MRQYTLLLVLSASACTSGFDSGVQGDKHASTVTDTEARQFCERLDDWPFGDGFFR